MTQTTAEQPASRPRIDGEREAEIYAAVIEALVDVGYDKLTFDAVAAAARASKATLYRRWRTKAELVLDALTQGHFGEPESVDTGTLRGDMLAVSCAQGGLCDKSPAVVGALVPALHRDPELRRGFLEQVVVPKLDQSVELLRRAQSRGEVGPRADLQLLAQTLPAICIHEAVLFGTSITPERVAHILDTVVLPACRSTLRETTG